MADYLSLAYGTVVFLGGVLGYVKAGSVMSLGSGIMFGSLLLYGVYRTTTNPRDTLFLLVVSGVLTCVMGYRFYNSGKFMPAGLVTILSLFQVMRLGYPYLM
jgi:uncharacterized membrane protein (UPF0136 family)